MSEPTSEATRPPGHPDAAAGEVGHRDGGPVFWITTAIGWSVMAGAVIGALGDRRDAQPTVLARWLVGSALLHDLLWLPIVAIVGAVLARVSRRGRVPAPVRWAIATSAVLALIAWPFVRGYGRNQGNPSLLPRNYARGLVAYIMLTWLLAGLALAIGRWRRDATAPGPGGRVMAVDVILPALDEERALPALLAALPAGYRAVVVDNGSTDRTAEVAAAGGALVVREPRRGFGSACWTGLVAASADVVCFMDADGSFDPGELPKVADPVIVGDADLVLAARRAAPGAWPGHARAANRVLAFELRRRLGLALHDLGPMRAARRHDLLALGIEDRRSGWPLEMVVLAARRAGALRRRAWPTRRGSGARRSPAPCAARREPSPT